MINDAYKNTHNIMLGIPCYRCENQISRTLEGVFSQDLRSISCITILDNCSPDNTFENANSFIKNLKNKEIPKIRLIQARENYGLGGSFQKLFEISREMDFSHFLLFHGDDQADAEDIKIFLKQLNKNPEIDAFLGSRFMKTSRLENYSKVREYGNLLINEIVSKIIGKKILDTGSGINLYKVESIPEVIINSLPSSITFDFELLLWFLKEGRKIEFIPIVWKEEDQNSNVKNLDVAYNLMIAALKSKLFGRSFNEDRKLKLPTRKYLEVEY